MRAIGFQLPEDAVAVRDGVMRFVEVEVLPRLERNHALLDDSRRTYAADGRYTPEVRALIREVRMASAAAGFYAMCDPNAMGDSVSSVRAKRDADAGDAESAGALPRRHSRGTHLDVFRALGTGCRL